MIYGVRLEEMLKGFLQRRRPRDEVYNSFVFNALDFEGPLTKAANAMRYHKHRGNSSNL